MDKELIILISIVEEVKVKVSIFIYWAELKNVFGPSTIHVQVLDENNCKFQKKTDIRANILLRSIITIPKFLVK